MRYLLIGILALVLGGCGECGSCGEGEGSRKEPAADRESAAVRDSSRRERKQAPVQIEAERIEATSASLRITFRAAGEDVRVTVYGTDGLEVSPEAGSHQSPQVEAGQVLSLHVPFSTGGAAHTNLAVSVEGTFRGRPGSRVASFTVGAALPSGPVAAAALRATTSDGRPIKTLPAREK